MQPSAGEVPAKLLGYRRDQGARAVTGDDRGGDVLVREHGSGVGRDLAGITRLGRIKQVVAEGDVHAVAGRARADHDDAAGGVKPQQVRDSGENLGRGTDLDRRLPLGTWLIQRNARLTRAGG